MIFYLFVVQLKDISSCGTQKNSLMQCTPMSTLKFCLICVMILQFPGRSTLPGEIRPSFIHVSQSQPDHPAQYAIDLKYDTRSVAIPNSTEENGNCWYEVHLKEVIT